TPGLLTCSNTAFGNTFNDPVGVTDLYWGTGTNNNVDNKGKRMPLCGLTPNFTLPSPTSPLHQVICSGNLTSIVQIGGCDLSFFACNNFATPSCDEYGAFVYTNQVAPNQTVIQVVFAPINNPGFSTA